MSPAGIPSAHREGRARQRPSQAGRVSPVTPRVRYQADLRRTAILPDPAQAKVVEHTQRLYEELLASGARRAWWRRLPGLAPPPVRGLYLWGGPGRGKSWLADGFFDCLPFPEKRRVHFHRFMLSVHQQLGELPRTPNPLVIIARRLAAELRVLCLDEFHVQDIADAMLLDVCSRPCSKRASP